MIAFFIICIFAGILLAPFFAIAQGIYDRKYLDQLRKLRIQVLSSKSESEKKRLQVMAEDINIKLQKSILKNTKSESKALLNSIKSY